MLYEFVQLHREEIIKRCLAKVATRSVPPPTEAEIDHGVPLFLEQLVATLRSGGAKLTTEISRSAVLYGHDLLLQGFTVSQLVHDYGDVCQSITDLAMEMNAPISTDLPNPESAFRLGRLTSCSARSSNAAATERALGLDSPSADGALERTTVSSRRATCRGRDVCSRSTCRDTQSRRLLTGEDPLRLRD